MVRVVLSVSPQNRSDETFQKWKEEYKHTRLVAAILFLSLVNQSVCVVPIMMDDLVVVEEEEISPNR